MTAGFYKESRNRGSKQVLRIKQGAKDKAEFEIKQDYR